MDGGAGVDFHASGGIFIRHDEFVRGWRGALQLGIGVRKGRGSGLRVALLIDLAEKEKVQEGDSQRCSALEFGKICSRRSGSKRGMDPMDLRNIAGKQRDRAVFTKKIGGLNFYVNFPKV